jgi:hypothetical protein
MEVEHLFIFQKNINIHEYGLELKSVTISDNEITQAINKVSDIQIVTS